MRPKGQQSPATDPYLLNHMIYNNSLFQNVGKDGYSINGVGIIEFPYANEMNLGPGLKPNPKNQCQMDVRPKMQKGK